MTDTFKIVAGLFLMLPVVGCHKLPDAQPSLSPAPAVASLAASATLAVAQPPVINNDCWNPEVKKLRKRRLKAT
jgi:hypothetical protein